MRKSTFVVIALSAAAAGCGSSSKYANKPPPAPPVQLTVYISPSRVSVSPDRIGAGAVTFTVTNQATASESLAIGASGGQSLADTGPINPQGTAQLSVALSSPGDYTVSTTAGGTSDAAGSTAGTIQPATIHIGPPRPTTSNHLLTP